MGAMGAGALARWSGRDLLPEGAEDAACGTRPPGRHGEVVRSADARSARRHPHQLLVGHLERGRGCQSRETATPTHPILRAPGQESPHRGSGLGLSRFRSGGACRCRAGCRAGRSGSGRRFPGRFPRACPEDPDGEEQQRGGDSAGRTQAVLAGRRVACVGCGRWGLAGPPRADRIRRQGHLNERALDRFQHLGGTFPAGLERPTAGVARLCLPKPFGRGLPACHC